MISVPLDYLLGNRQAHMKNSVKNSVPTRDRRGRLSGGNPGNKGGRKGRSGRPPAEFRAWALTMRDTVVQGAVEEILKNPGHKDRFRAIEFIAKHASEAETTLTDDEVLALAEQQAYIVVRHLPEPERRARYLADVRDLLETDHEIEVVPQSLLHGKKDAAPHT